MTDTGPLSDHEIAQALVTFPAHWTVVRACQELVTFRSAVRAIVSDKTLTLGEVRQRLEELAP